MLGAIIIAVVVIVVIPVGVIMSSVLAAVAIGWSLKDDARRPLRGQRAARAERVGP